MLHVLANSLEKRRKVSLTFKKGVYERFTSNSDPQDFSFLEMSHLSKPELLLIFKI